MKRFSNFKISHRKGIQRVIILSSQRNAEIYLKNIKAKKPYSVKIRNRKTGKLIGKEKHCVNYYAALNSIGSKRKRR